MTQQKFHIKFSSYQKTLKYAYNRFGQRYCGKIWDNLKTITQYNFVSTLPYVPYKVPVQKLILMAPKAGMNNDILVK